MATNNVFFWHESLRVTPTEPASPSSGDPVVFGQIPGVALTNPDADGNVTVALDGVWELPVTGAVAGGDIVYYKDGQLSADNTGVRFGYALAAVASGATSTIPVRVGY